MARVSLISAGLRGRGQDSRIFTASEAAEILGLTNQRLTQLVKEGMPRTGHGQYTIESIKWYISYQRKQLEEKQSETIVAERLRLTRAKADKAEVEARRAEDKALDVDEVRGSLMQVLRLLKDNLLVVPQKVSQEHAGEMRSYIIEALNDTADQLENIASGGVGAQDG